MSTPGAWFLLASSNGDTFNQAFSNDLLIYTDRTTQRILLGSIGVPTMFLSTSNISVFTPTVIQNNVTLNSNGIFLSPSSIISLGSNFTIDSNGISGCNLINTNSLSDGSITTNKLSNLAVTNSKLGSNSITDDKIATNTILTRSIADGAITSAKISNAGSFYINNVQISAPSNQLFVGYSNSNINQTYAISQNAANETFINSGYSNPIHFSVGGKEVMTLNSIGDLDVTGLVTQTSDRNLKWDIKHVDDGLQKLLQLNGYTYKMRDHDESAGLIAQEVMQVLPQAVKTSKASKSLTLDYASVSCLYVEAIKDLYKMVLDLQEKINDMSK